MGKRSSFSDSVRRAAVEEVLDGRESRSVVARKYGISESGFREWIKAYKEGRLDGGVVKGVYYERKVEDLERMIGKQAVEIEFLKKALNWTRMELKKEESLSKTIYGLSRQSEGDAN